MRTFLVVAAIFALPFLLWLFMSMVAAFVRVLRGGKSEAREFARSGLTLRTFWAAKVDRQDSGSMIPTRAGIGVSYKNGKFIVRETRTISKDIF